MTSPRLTCSALQAELDMSARISSLEGRAARLEADFSDMLRVARDLAAGARQYVTRMELEQKCESLLGQIREMEQSGRVILNHLKVFFNFLLAKMQKRGAEITDITMLWHLLASDQGVQVERHNERRSSDIVHRPLQGCVQVIKTKFTLLGETFTECGCSFGFRVADVQHLLVLLGMVYRDHMDMCRPVDSGREKGDEAITLKAAVEKDSTISKDSKILEATFLDLDVDKHTSISAGDLKSLYIDDDLRKVVRRAVAIVLSTMGSGTVAETDGGDEHQCVPLDCLN